MRPVPPATRLLPLLALLLVAAHAWAARAVRVYEVDLAERSGSALQQAMREALVRATGRREAAEDPALARIVAEAAGYVKGYATGPRGESQVIFDGAAVEQAVTAAGRAVWDSARPFTLIALDPPRARAAADAARVELERTATERGLPVSLIPLPLEDSAARPLEAQALLQSAQRYGGDELLVGRGEGETLQWTLYDARGASAPWSGPLSAGIEHTVDLLVPAQASSAQAPEADARIDVEGVRTLSDYANVTRLLQATPGVKRVGLVAAQGTTASFDVTVRGGPAALEQALAGHAHLSAGSSPGGAVLYHYQP